MVGENGSGKTAFLESIFLACGATPETWLRMRAWRGLEGNFAGIPRQVEDAIWGDLFHDGNKRQSVSINLRGSDHHNRSVTVIHRPSESTPRKTQKTDRRREGAYTFVYRGGTTYRVLGSITPRLVEGKLEIQAFGDTTLDCAFFAANQTYSSVEAVSRFSEISRRSEENELVSHFRSQFQNVEDLSIEVLGGSPYIFAKLEKDKEKTPVNSLSGGMNKWASILFAIPVYSRGIIIIDEIENGFYYKRFRSIWKSIHHFAKIYDTQIFASTHSAECLQAAADTAQSSPSDFSVIRPANGKIRQFGGDRFVEAMEENIEIR